MISHIFEFLPLFGGAGLMLLGVRYFSSSFQALFDGFIRQSIHIIGQEKWRCLLSGALAAFLVQSSLATASMGVSFSTSGLFSFTQLTCFLTGTDLGTAFTPFFFTLDIGHWDWLILALAGFILLISRSERLTALANLSLSLGLLFLGKRTILEYSSVSSLTELLAPLSGSPWGSFGAAFWLSLLAMGLVRSRTVLVIWAGTLCSLQILSPQTVFPMILGINLGEHLWLYVRGLEGSVMARRGALVHLGGTLATLSVFMFFSQESVELNQILLKSWFGELDPAREFMLFAPFSHALFNVVRTFLGLILDPVLQGVAIQMVRSYSKKEPHRLTLLGPVVQISPSLSVELVDQELKKMAVMVNSILHLTQEVIEPTVESAKSKQIEKIAKYEGITDSIDQEVLEALQKIMELRLTPTHVSKMSRMLHMTKELEKIADSCLAIYHRDREIREQGQVLSVQLRSVLGAWLRETILRFEDVCSFWLQGLSRAKAKSKWDAESAYAALLVHPEFRSLIPDIGKKLIADLNSFKRIDECCGNLEKLLH